MTDIFDRRHVMHLTLAAVPGLLLASTSTLAADAARPATNASGPQHDFDFFLGHWNMRHRRLKQRLANNDEWEEFDGATRCEAILGGYANFNDSIVYRSSGTYRSLGLRAYDPKTNTWADWYLNGRDPTRIDPPGIGSFADGVGRFFSDDTFEGRPIKVRGIFTSISRDAMQWEQAFSPDGGKTWETNWVMRYTRIARADF